MLSPSPVNVHQVSLPPGGSMIRQPPPSSSAFPIIPKAIKSYQQLQQTKPVAAPTMNEKRTPPPSNIGVIQPTPTQSVFTLPSNTSAPIRPIPITPKLQSSPIKASNTPGRPSSASSTQSGIPTSAPIMSATNYVPPFNDILNSSDQDVFILRNKDHTIEFREFTESQMPVVTYSFTEDSINNLWSLNLIWPVDRRQLSWRGRFIFYVRIFKRVNHDTYTHMMSKISSPFCIFSKPDVYLKKIRKEETTGPRRRGPNMHSSPKSEEDESTNTQDTQTSSQGSQPSQTQTIVSSTNGPSMALQQIMSMQQIIQPIMQYMPHPTANTNNLPNVIIPNVQPPIVGQHSIVDLSASSDQTSNKRKRSESEEAEERERTNKRKNNSRSLSENEAHNGAATNLLLFTSGFYKNGETGDVKSECTE
ncbi:FEN1 [Acrasis kona]|uniref:FEN1 n=1 Tax=Acrasis kona TaxID=1008807 RepID=A0AAW2Z6X9_9EUKA